MFGFGVHRVFQSPFLRSFLPALGLARTRHRNFPKFQMALKDFTLTGSARVEHTVHDRRVRRPATRYRYSGRGGSNRIFHERAGKRTRRLQAAPRFIEELKE